MTGKQWILGAVLIDFAALTAYAFAQAGVSGFAAAAESLFSSPWGLQLACDFLVALGLVSWWMVADARERGVAAWPFLLLTLTLGSIGPLVYLNWREWTATAAARDEPRGLRQRA